MVYFVTNPKLSTSSRIRFLCVFVVLSLSLAMNAYRPFGDTPQPKTR